MTAAWIGLALFTAIFVGGVTVLFLRATRDVDGEHDYNPGAPERGNLF